MNNNNRLTHLRMRRDLWIKLRADAEYRMAEFAKDRDQAAAVIADLEREIRAVEDHDAG